MRGSQLPFMVISHSINFTDVCLPLMSFISNRQYNQTLTCVRNSMLFLTMSMSFIYKAIHTRFSLNLLVYTLINMRNPHFTTMSYNLWYQYIEDCLRPYINLWILHTNWLQPFHAKYLSCFKYIFSSNSTLRKTILTSI